MIRNKPQAQKRIKNLASTVDWVATAALLERSNQPSLILDRRGVVVLNTPLELLSPVGQKKNYRITIYAKKTTNIGMGWQLKMSMPATEVLVH